MHIFHICGDFLGTSVHISLFRELDNLGIVQSIFVPIKKNTDTTRNKIVFKTAGSAVFFSRRMNVTHKFLYGLKISQLVHDVERQIDLRHVDVIHASLLCKEGAVAYELHKKYGLPYIVSVRNTDINGYIRHFIWRRSYFRKIALHARRIVFISSQYPSKLEKALTVQKDERYVVVHNGIQEYYIEHIFKGWHELHQPVRVVMACAFVKNKNIHGAVRAVAMLRERGYNVVLKAIGNHLSSYHFTDSSYSDRIQSLANEYPWFEIYEAQAKEQLVVSLRESDIFLLPSFTETFGLSYLEALSQGIPIVYTRGEGFDGTYSEGLVGYGASATDVDSISKAIENVIMHYPELCKNVSDLDFSIYEWTNIALRYQDMYETIVAENKNHKVWAYDC